MGGVFVLFRPHFMRGDGAAGYFQHLYTGLGRARKLDGVLFRIFRCDHGFLPDWIWILLQVHVKRGTTNLAVIRAGAFPGGDLRWRVGKVLRMLQLPCRGVRAEVPEGVRGMCLKLDHC